MILGTENSVWSRAPETERLAACRKASEFRFASRGVDRTRTAPHDALRC